MRKEREVLEDRGGRALVGRKAEEALAVEQDLAARRLLVSADHP
jgi:hypothetical protein